MSWALARDESQHGRKATAKATAKTPLMKKQMQKQMQRQNLDNPSYLREARAVLAL
jgi:hypothetical protein